MPHLNIRSRTNSLFHPYEGETRVRQIRVRLCHTSTLDLGPIVSFTLMKVRQGLDRQVLDYVTPQH